MEDYTQYIFAAYFITGIIIIGLSVVSVIQYVKTKKQLQTLKQLSNETQT